MYQVMSTCTLPASLDRLFARGPGYAGPIFAKIERLHTIADLVEEAYLSIRRELLLPIHHWATSCSYGVTPLTCNIQLPVTKTDI